MKKMKKRRELDALVNGKLGRKKSKGQHELLRAESESSDVEEFSIPEQAVVRKRGSSRFCAACLMGCGFFLLLACLVAIVGLVWVHIELKRDVDLLQLDIRRLESGSQSNPEEFQSLHSRQQDLEKTINDLKSGDSGLEKLQKTVDNANRQIALLNSTTSDLKKSMSASEQIIGLPKKVTQATKEIADLGSNMESIKSDITKLQQANTELSAKVDNLNEQLTELLSTSNPNAGNPTDSLPVDDYFKNELGRLSTDFTVFNTSVMTKLADMHTAHMATDLAVQGLRNNSLSLESRVGLLEVAAPAGDNNLTADVMRGIVQNAMDGVMRDMKNLSMSSSAALAGSVQQQVEELRQQVTALANSSAPAAGAGQAELLAALHTLNTTVYTQHAEFVEQITSLQTQLSALTAPPAPAGSPVPDTGDGEEGAPGAGDPATDPSEPVEEQAEDTKQGSAFRRSAGRAEGRRQHVEEQHEELDDFLRQLQP